MPGMVSLTPRTTSNVEAEPLLEGLPVLARRFLEQGAGGVVALHLFAVHVNPGRGRFDQPTDRSLKRD